MPDTPSITIIKRMTYRGKDEEWSNKYHFTGPTPGSDAAWKTLADAIILTEKACYPPTHRVVRVYGHEAGNEHAVAQIDFTSAPLTPVTGTANGDAGYPPQAGDAAYWIRAKTPDRGANGKWIYVRKYMHGGLANDAGVIQPAQRTSALAHGVKMTDGSLPNGVKWSGPQGASTSAPQVGQYMTTRTLKRRGKRPSS